MVLEVGPLKVASWHGVLMVVTRNGDYPLPLFLSFSPSSSFPFPTTCENITRRERPDASPEYLHQQLNCPPLWYCTVCSLWKPLGPQKVRFCSYWCWMMKYRVSWPSSFLYLLCLRSFCSKKFKEWSFCLSDTPEAQDSRFRQVPNEWLFWKPHAPYSNSSLVIWKPSPTHLTTLPPTLSASLLLIAKVI